MPKEIVNLKKLDELSKNNPLSYGVMIYYDINKDTRKAMKSKTSKKKYTLNQLGKKVDQIGDALFNFINYVTNEFKHVHSRLDNLEKDVGQLKHDVKILKNDVKGINTRLDYIVTANKLKDLPKVSK